MAEVRDTNKLRWARILGIKMIISKFLQSPDPEVVAMAWCRMFTNLHHVSSMSGLTLRLQSWHGNRHPSPSGQPAPNRGFHPTDHCSTLERSTTLMTLNIFKNVQDVQDVNEYTSRPFTHTVIQCSMMMIKGCYFPRLKTQSHSIQIPLDPS